MKYVCEKFIICDFAPSCKLGRPIKGSLLPTSPSYLPPDDRFGKTGLQIARIGSNNEPMFQCRLSIYSDLDAVILQMAIDPSKIWTEENCYVNLVEVEDEDGVEYKGDRGDKETSGVHDTSRP